MLGYPFGGWIAAGLFFLLLTAVLLSRLVVRGIVSRIGEDDHVELRIRGLMGLVNYHWELPIMRFTSLSKGVEMKQEKTSTNMGGDSEQISKEKVDKETIIKQIDWMRVLLQQTDQLLGWVRITLNHVHLTDWRWRSAVGTGDAMWTAMLTGMAWTVKTTAIGVISQLIRLKTEPKVTVEPVYAKAHFSTEWHFSAHIRLGYAIFAGVHLLYRMRKARGILRGLVGWQRILMRA
ncbi:hypothetical protein FHS18_001286 [Paenibacillus phyllosphaerae]|uniref:DUF2953 domain-containing protein n=1 Tax=Paenibacillus phyllosphaerae TaxID=274593 RepID=A0A7W5AUX5_9BACL|nr:DUF2953 domain-containing protein [Paenibacillus phyllosphaerae]MBB3109234.1 hypothetical protein [Paenibacillus phyllosphaerae]